MATYSGQRTSRSTSGSWTPSRIAASSVRPDLIRLAPVVQVDLILIRCCVQVSLKASWGSTRYRAGRDRGPLDARVTLERGACAAVDVVARGRGAGGSRAPARPRRSSAPRAAPAVGQAPPGRALPPQASDRQRLDRADRGAEL